MSDGEGTAAWARKIFSARHDEERERQAKQNLTEVRAADAAKREVLSKAPRKLEETGAVDTEAVRVASREDPLKKRRKLLDELAALRSNAAPGSSEFEQARQTLEDELIVTKPEPAVAGMTPAEVEGLTNERLSAEIARREAKAKTSTPEGVPVAVEEPAEEQALPSAEAAPSPELISRNFDAKVFGRALLLPENSLLPQGRLRVALEQEFSAALEANISNILEGKVLGGSLEGTGFTFPDAVVTQEDRLRFVRERASEQVRSMQEMSGIWNGSLIMMKALEKSGLTHEQALRTAVYAVTNQAKINSPVIFAIKLRDGAVGDPMDAVFVAISRARSGERDQAARVTGNLEFLFTMKQQELRDVELG